MERILKPNGLIFVAFNQRSGVKNWRVGSIQKERFIGDDGVSMFEESRRILGPLTHVPIEGTEKGLIHYAFDRKAIKKEFKDFKIHRLGLDSKKCRYILLAESKKINAESSCDCINGLFFVPDPPFQPACILILF